MLSFICPTVPPSEELLKCRNIAKVIEFIAHFRTVALKVECWDPRGSVTYIQVHNCFAIYYAFM